MYRDLDFDSAMFQQRTELFLKAGYHFGLLENYSKLPLVENSIIVITQLMHL